MNFSALAMTAITNFVLAAQAYFIAGLLFARKKERWSAQWCWQLVIFGLATSALIGGIDHGFFEIHGDTPIRNLIKHFNWFFIGIVTFFVFLTLAQQFTSGKVKKVFLIIAAIQLCAYIISLFFVDTFLFVIVNYAPVMLVLLIINIISGKNGKGSWQMTAGIIISFAASFLQMGKVKITSIFDHNSLYHVVMMVAVAIFYYAGTKLDSQTPKEN